MGKTLVVALCLAAAGALAQNQPQLGDAEVSYQVVGPSSNGISNVVPCIFQDVSGFYHAAVAIDVPRDDTYYVQFWIFYKTLECDVEPDFVGRDIQLPRSHLILYLNTPLPSGYLISMIWADIGAYMGDSCVPYQIPDSPDMCS